MTDLSRNEQGLSSMESTLVAATCRSSAESVCWASSVGRRPAGEEDPFFGRQVCVKSGVLTGLTGAVVGSLEGDRLLIAVESDQHALFLAIDQTAIAVAQSTP